MESLPNQSVNKYATDARVFLPADTAPIPMQVTI